MFVLYPWNGSMLAHTFWFILRIANYFFKVALITILTSTTDQMAVCNVKCVAHSDEPTENFKRMQFWFALWSILASMSSLFWLYGRELYVSPMFWWKSSDKQTACPAPDNGRKTQLAGERRGEIIRHFPQEFIKTIYRLNGEWIYWTDIGNMTPSLVAPCQLDATIG